MESTNNILIRLVPELFTIRKSVLGETDSL